MKIKPFVVDYLDRLKIILDQINPNIISDIVDTLEQTLVEKSRIYIIGNGGSSATASHMVNDLGSGLRRRDIINFDVLSLGDNSPVVTAIANDIGYERIYSEQLSVMANPDDVLIVLSGSGNSPNIVAALEQAKAMNVKSYAILGFSGGRSKQLADVPIHFSVDDMQISEDLQLVVGHMLMQWLYANRPKLQ